ncbi:hypothetical protein SAMN05443550_102497 [Pedobacter hartonius]|uniref:Uncharacterized protein n=1 Tax=Pedobacter hartonius TaxID=425514 RepID=A0A1H3ZVP3_9SPHI|nr:hypothetical protein [Pedobacter hartonius]SEA27362.1 hypothetical protein SAMN05443550_102497 [Pedobacter hartonius]
MTEHADLKNQIGNDVIAASGTTLLGADNKAGLAEIMESAALPEYFYGRIRLPWQAGMGSLQDMEKAVETIVNLVQIWEEKSS